MSNPFDNLQDRPRVQVYTTNPFEGRTPDAVMASLFFCKRRDVVQGMRELSDLVKTILGRRKVYIRDQGLMRFMSGHPDDKLLFPSWHERHPEPRYDWIDRGDGMLYGYLKPDPPLPESLSESESSFKSEVKPADAEAQ